MSNNIFDLLRTDLPTKKASAPKVSAPKATAPKASTTAVTPKAKAAVPAKNASSVPKKEATFNAERALKEDNKRQGEKKIRAPREDRNTDFTWKEGDDKPAVKSTNPEKQIRAIAGNNRRERRAFEAKVTEAGEVAPQKRQFDRRSAHPAGEVKKGGFGRGNWGTPGSEVEGEAKEKREQRPRGEKRERRAPREGDEKKEFVPRELTEEEKLEQAEREAEAKLLTLGQYKKKIAAEKVKIELPKARQAGEGVADQWSEYSVLEKPVDTEKPVKKTADAAPAKVDEALVAHSQAALKKKQAEKKILSDLLKGRTPNNNNGPRRDSNRRGEQKQAAAQEFGLVVDEFPSL